MVVIKWVTKKSVLSGEERVACLSEMGVLQIEKPVKEIHKREKDWEALVYKINYYSMLKIALLIQNYTNLNTAPIVVKILMLS